MLCGEASLVAQIVNNLPATWRSGFDPWVGKIPLEKGTAAHPSVLAWKIPWTEEPGGPFHGVTKSWTGLSD